jgi:predicted NAD-dependent protein-ADP-ribosyltransferase YbiA (DUF1768 family)
LNGNNFLKVGPTNAATVFDDGERDTIWGDQGTDWFFANLVGGVLDDLRDRARGESNDDPDRLR